MRWPIVCFLLASTLGAQSTWVVNPIPGPGVHFTSLPAAVAAAASGDTLLVAAGQYDPFQVSGKALIVRGAGIGATAIVGSAAGDFVRIQSVPNGAVFRMSGLTIHGTFPNTTGVQNQLAVRGPTAGSTTLTDVVVDSANGGGSALFVDGCRVFANRCSFASGVRSFSSPQGSGTFGDTVVYANNGADLVADDCAISGWGVVGFYFSATHGGSGLQIDNSAVRLSRCSVHGGSVTGGFANSYGGTAVLMQGTASLDVIGTPAQALRGGDAAPVAGVAVPGYGISAMATTTLRVHGTPTIAAGTGGTAIPAILGIVPSFAPPLPTLVLAGVGKADGDLDATQPVAATLGGGPANALYALLFDMQPGLQPLPALTDEPLLLGPAATFVEFGLLDAAGAHATTFTPATAAPLLVGLMMELQAYAFDPGTGRWLGSNLEQRRAS